VLTSHAVAEAADFPLLVHVLDERSFKGIEEPVAVFRALRNNH
jgi:class 3 adenylate cyclase